MKFTELDCQMLDPILISLIVEKSFENTTIEKKGYDQAGKKNNHYKNGISTYAQNKKSHCEKCGSTKNLMVHHKDGNRKNNNASNLQTLCWKCHEGITQRK